MKTKTYITVKQANALTWPRPLLKQTEAIYESGVSPELVFYIINKGQTGSHKIMHERFFGSHDEASKFLKTLDKFVADTSEVRCGLFVEGPTVQ